MKIGNPTYGQWEESINAFWCGGMDTEYVAWKGSHQIFVYPCQEYPNMPSEVIQYTKRIYSVEDFDDALINGVRHSVAYEVLGIGAFE